MMMTLVVVVVVVAVIRIQQRWRPRLRETDTNKNASDNNHENNNSKYGAHNEIDEHGGKEEEESWLTSPKQNKIQKSTVWAYKRTTIL